MSEAHRALWTPPSDIGAYDPAPRRLAARGAEKLKKQNRAGSGRSAGVRSGNRSKIVFTLRPSFCPAPRKANSPEGSVQKESSGLLFAQKCAWRHAVAVNCALFHIVSERCGSDDAGVISELCQTNLCLGFLGSVTVIDLFADQREQRL